ncbi:MAG TPA: hypothetical protein V6D34_13950 [Candidatus Sericytochromatia bacterium]|jgi:hypothetical protein
MKSDFSQAIQSVKNTAGSLMDTTASSVVTETKITLDKLENSAGEAGQTLSSLTTNLAQSVTGLNEATTKLKTSVLEATGGAIDTITKTSNQAANVLKEKTVQSTDALNSTTDIAVHRLHNATDSMTQTAEKTKLALNESVQKAEHLRGVISSSVHDVVATSMKAWMSEHPILSWIIAHPLWSIALLVVVLFLCWSLLGAIAQFTQQAWLALLQAPLKATQLLSRGAFQSLKRADVFSSTELTSQKDVQERLSKIVSRLEVLQQEEEALIREMQSILILKIEE